MVKFLNQLPINIVQFLLFDLSQFMQIFVNFNGYE